MNAGNKNLYEIKDKNSYIVVSVPDIDLLENMGLRIGTQIEVQNRYALDGPVLLRVEDAYSIAIGKDIATQIGVSESSMTLQNLVEKASDG